MSAEAENPIIEDLEAAVVALLQPLKAVGFDVEALPEDKTGFDAAVIKPRATVGYRESTFGDAKNPSYAGLLGEAVAQEETLHFDVIARARGRKSDRGTYAVVEAIRLLLFGAKPLPGFNRFNLAGARLEEFEEKGVWRYSLSLTTTTVIVSDVERALPFAITQLSVYWQPEGVESATVVFPAPAP